MKGGIIMKKTLVFITMVLLLSVLVLAAPEVTTTKAPESKGTIEAPMGPADAAGNGTTTQTAHSPGEPMARIQGDGQFMLQNGERLSYSSEGTKTRLQSGEHTAICEGCNLNEENGKLKATMSNGQNAEIKIMPDTASERAIERLQIKSKNQNFSIELKEVGTGNQTRMAYEVQTRKEARVFGIFKTEMDVEAQVDAETGEVIKSKKPWWAFIAAE